MQKVKKGSTFCSLVSSKPEINSKKASKSKENEQKDEEFQKGRLIRVQKSIENVSRSLADNVLRGVLERSKREIKEPSPFKFKARKMVYTPIGASQSKEPIAFQIFKRAETKSRDFFRTRGHLPLASELGTKETKYWSVDPVERIKMIDEEIAKELRVKEEGLRLEIIQKIKKTIFEKGIAEKVSEKQGSRKRTEATSRCENSPKLLKPGRLQSKRSVSQEAESLYDGSNGIGNGQNLFKGSSVNWKKEGARAKTSNESPKNQRKNQKGNPRMLNETTSNWTGFKPNGKREVESNVNGVSRREYSEEIQKGLGSLKGPLHLKLSFHELQRDQLETKQTPGLSSGNEKESIPEMIEEPKEPEMEENLSQNQKEERNTQEFIDKVFRKDHKRAKSIARLKTKSKEGFPTSDNSPSGSWGNNNKRSFPSSLKASIHSQSLRGSTHGAWRPSENIGNPLSKTNAEFYRSRKQFLTAEDIKNKSKFFRDPFKSDSTAFETKDSRTRETQTARAQKQRQPSVPGLNLGPLTKDIFMDDWSCQMGQQNSGENPQNYDGGPRDKRALALSSSTHASQGTWRPFRVHRPITHSTKGDTNTIRSLYSPFLMTAVPVQTEKDEKEGTATGFNPTSRSHLP